MNNAYSDDRILNLVRFYFNNNDSGNFVEKCLPVPVE